MTKERRVLILGDSLGFARPTHGQLFSSSWPVLVKNNLPDLDIWQRCRPAATINVIKDEYGLFSAYANEFGSFVFQVGVTDSCPRPFPYIVQQLLVRLTSAKVMRFINQHYHHLLVLRSKPWVSPKCFRKTLTTLIDDIASKNADAKIAFVRIADAGEGYQKKVKGVQQSIRDYNLILENVVHDNRGRIHLELLDPYNRENMQELLLPDGHHLTEEGHQCVAQAVAKFLLD